MLKQINSSKSTQPLQLYSLLAIVWLIRHRTSRSLRLYQSWQTALFFDTDIFASRFICPKPGGPSSNKVGSAPSVETVAISNVSESTRIGRSILSNHQTFSCQLHELVWRLPTLWLVALNSIICIKIEMVTLWYMIKLCLLLDKAFWYLL